MNWLVKSVIALVWLLWFSTAIAAIELSTEPDRLRGGDFVLKSGSGTVSLDQFRGNVVLIFFGFTSCPDICPITLSVMSRVLNQLQAEEREQVKGMFVSLDPERDTLPVLQKYTAYFHPEIIGVTDEIGQIRQVTDQYGVMFEKKDMASSPIGYVINHSTDIFVVNRQGQLLASRISPAQGVDEITRFVRRLLQE